MRWLVFCLILFGACGIDSHEEVRDTLPGIELVRKIDSLNKAERTDPQHPLMDAGHVFKQSNEAYYSSSRFRSKRLVTTLRLTTAAGQAIMEELWRNRWSYFLVLGGDTVSTEKQMLSEENSGYQTFAAFFRDSTLEFPYPLKVIAEEKLDSIAALPDEELRRWTWMVRHTLSYNGSSCFCPVKFELLQLDDDLPLERIGRLIVDSDMGVTVDYEVFNNTNGTWRRVGCVSVGDHTGVCDDPIFYQRPYFGFYNHGWGSCFGSTSLEIFRLHDDTIYRYIDIFDQQMFTCVGGMHFDNGGEERYESSVKINSGRMTLDYTYSLIAHSATDQEVSLLNHVHLNFTLKEDTIQHCFKMQKKKNSDLLSLDPDKSAMLNEQLLMDAYLKPLAKHGTPAQRKVLSHFR